jgi:hypothetical protein
MWRSSIQDCSDSSWLQGKAPLPPGRADDRGAKLLRDGQQGLLRPAPAGSAAGDDRRTLGRLQPFHRFADQLNARRVVRRFRERVLHWRNHDRIEQDVLRNFDPHRPLGRGDRLGPGVLDGRRNAGRMLDQPLALGDVGGRRFLVIELVQHALAPGAEAIQRDLAGHHHHRHAGGVGFLQPGQGRQGTGAGGEEQNAHLSGGA